MMKDVTVFTTWEEPIADMMVNLLQNEGINAFKKSSLPRDVFAFTFVGLGAINIRVAEEDFERAAEIIAVRFPENESSGGETDEPDE